MQEAQAPLPVGTVIHEHYSVESLLGKGDFGNVYLVRDPHDKQKLFALAEVIDPNEQESYRFALDYVSLAPLDHRTLPRVQYIFNDDKHSRAYVLIPYIEELNLEILRLQKAEKRLPLSQVMALMAPVIHGVTHLHHRRPPVFHRNIQPSNIVVPRTVEAPVLVLLNIVKEHHSTTTILPYFAPGYGAPEQYTGECSARTDIYGLGATCYTLVTGMVPPDALYRSTQLSNGEIDPLKPVNEVIPAVPTHIAEAIRRAVSIDANDRFSSVEQFLAALASPASQPSLKTSRNMPSTSSPPPAPVPKQPRTPYPWKLDGFRPNAASRQADKRPAPVPVSKQPRAPRSWKLGTLWPAASKRAVEEPAPVPKQPRTPYPWKLDGFRPNAASRQADKRPAPVPVSKQPRAPRSWKFGIVFIILALLISLGIGAGFWSHARSLPAARSATPAPTVMRSTPKPAPTATFVSSIYPAMAGTYNGTIFDISVNVSTSMSLTGIRQSQGNIGGYLALGPKLQGSGPFNGTIDATKHVQFIVTDAAGHATLFFEGVMQSATSLNGDYYSCSHVSPAQGGRCSQAPGSYGIWNVVLT